MSHNARTNSGIRSLMTEIGLLPLPEDEPAKREQSLKNSRQSPGQIIDLIGSIV
jgi:hypothetical protein